MDIFVEHRTENREDYGDETYRVAIVGCGPKGLYGFERLVAELKSNPSDRKVEIHLFNKTANFGSGEIWNPAQPDFLMVNFCIGNINMWTKDTPPSVVGKTLSLTDWLKQKDPNISELDFVPRGVVGEYLDDGFAQILDNLPDKVSVEKHIGEVFDIEKIKGNFKLSVRKKDSIEKIETEFQVILLTTGHSSRHQSGHEKSYTKFTGEFQETGFTPFVYPIENLKHIPVESNVAIKGLGLTFIDSVLALTEGRGGFFERNEKGEITHYVPNGKEPRAIYPFSRSSLPILTRGAHFGEANFKLRFFTRENIAKLSDRAPDGRLNFTEDLWVLVEQEMIFAYYRILMRNSDFDCEGVAEFDEFEGEIERFHKEFENEKRFDLSEFIDPLKQKDYQTTDHREFIEKYIEKVINEAKLGEDESPFAAVVAVWREITPIFGEVYEFGGLSAETHRDFLENYFGNLCRITFGPPIESMEKILAVAKSGILKFEIGKEPKVLLDRKTGKFKVESYQSGFGCEVEYLIDARIPKKKIPQNASELYKNLAERGVIDVFRNGDFEVGCLNLSRNGSVYDRSGKLQENFVAYGTPTEGVTFDNDSLSRTRNNFAGDWAKRIRQAITVLT